MIEPLPPNETNRRFIGSLQALRFLAAAMVLVSHLLIESRTHATPGSMAVYDPTGIKWVAGVDVFFVISGFIMYYLTSDRFGVRGFAASFLENRFIRVIPLYWFYCTLFILAAIFSDGHVNNNEIDPIRVVASYLFLPWPRADGTFYPVFEIGWTLNFEIFFYLAFAAALLFTKPIGLTLLICLFVLLAGTGLATRTTLPFLMFYTRPIILEFLFGILLAHLYLRNVRLPDAARFGLVLAGLIGLMLAGNSDISENIHLRFFWGGLPATLIAAGVILGPDLRENSWYANLLVIGGNISYSLYLTHMFSLRLLTIVWEKLHLPGGWTFFLTSFVVAMVGAYVAYRLVEQPLLHLMRHGLRARKPRPALS